MEEDLEVISKVINTFNQNVTGNENVIQNVTGEGNKTIGKVDARRSLIFDSKI